MSARKCENHGCRHGRRPWRQQDTALGHNGGNPDGRHILAVLRGRATAGLVILEALTETLLRALKGRRGVRTSIELFLL